MREPNTKYVVLAKSFLKKDWLMCPACGLPQHMELNCCFDPNCMPHEFDADYCIHCGFDLQEADPTGYDVYENMFAIELGLEEVANEGLYYYCDNREKAKKQYEEAT